MVNYNGQLLPASATFLNHENRGLRYGDSLFETLRVVDGKVIFWEEHYLRLMASMRILRMAIPMEFTMEFLQTEIIKTITANDMTASPARVRLTIFRNAGGFYLPDSNEVSYCIECNALKAAFYTMAEEPYEIELFKDFYVNNDLTATLKTNNKIINVVGSIYAQENGYQNCLLLNTSKQITEALNGNIFMVNGTVVTTPPIEDGCLNGIIRKKIIEILGKIEGYTVQERSVSPFDLQKADELFITNSITGIRSITKYRKKEFERTVATDLLGKLNALSRLT